MILAIEQCHKQGFIHRDIKPDVGVMMIQTRIYADQRGLTELLV